MLSHSKYFCSQAKLREMSQCRALQLIATEAGKGLHALEMLFCVALLLTVHVTVMVPALTKKNPKK